MEIRKKTYGINFPFLESTNGDFIKLTDTPEQEVKSNLIHLLLTRKGSRYFLPEFGTNLYQYIFDPIDTKTISKIENEINTACEKFLPNLKINKINIDSIPSSNKESHTIKITIDYTVTFRTFQYNDLVTIVL